LSKKNIIESIYLKQVTKVNNSKLQKTYCPFGAKHKCQDNCPHMNFVGNKESVRGRWCYDEKFNLPNITDQIRVKRDGLTTVVQTGVVDQDYSSSNPNYVAEKEMKPVRPDSNMEYLNIIEQVCERNRISFPRFMKTLKSVSLSRSTKIKKELGFFNPNKKKKKKKKVCTQGQLGLF